MSIILIIVGIILLIMGFLGLGVLRKLKWPKVPLWYAAVEIALGIVIIVIGFMSL